LNGKKLNWEAKIRRESKLFLSWRFIKLFSIHWWNASWKFNDVFIYLNFSIEKRFFSSNFILRLLFTERARIRTNFYFFIRFSRHNICWFICEKRERKKIANNRKQILRFNFLHEESQAIRQTCTIQFLTSTHEMRYYCESSSLCFSSNYHRTRSWYFLIFNISNIDSAKFAFAWIFKVYDSQKSFISNGLMNNNHSLKNTQLRSNQNG
jgi:hypothetical protein